MNTKSILVSTIITSALTAYVSSAQPSGSITKVITDKGNVIWDCTQLANELENLDFTVKNQVEVIFSDPFMQDGKGKLSGAGSTALTVITSQPTQTVPGTYTTKGSITAAKGVARLTFNAKVTGTAVLGDNKHPTISRAVAASETATVTLNALNNTASGRNVKSAMAHGLGSVSETKPISGTIPADLGDGSWTLVINFGGSAGGSSASITLATGQVYPFSVSAPVTSHNGSKVTLTGTGAAAGSSLKVAFNTSNQIASIVGKVSGQSINYKP